MALINYSNRSIVHGNCNGLDAWGHSRLCWQPLLECTSDQSQANGLQESSCHYGLRHWQGVVIRQHDTWRAKQDADRWGIQLAVAIAAEVPRPQWEESLVRDIRSVHIRCARRWRQNEQRNRNGTYQEKYAHSSGDSIADSVPREGKLENDRKRACYDIGRYKWNRNAQPLQST